MSSVEGGSVKPESEPLSLPASSPAPAPVRLLDRMRLAIRVRHFAIRTEQTYVDWVRRFILFRGKRHLQDMGAAEVEAFLAYLATVRGVVSAKTLRRLVVVLNRGGRGVLSPLDRI